MSQPVQPIELAELRQMWRQWTAVIDRYAHRRRGGARISRGEYRALHVALLAACDASVAASNAIPASLPKKLCEIAEPWVTLESLRDSKPQILKSLLQRCYEIERDLLGRSRRVIQIQKIVSVCLLLAAVTIALVWFSSAQTDGKGFTRVAGEIQSLWVQLVYFIRFSSFLERFSIITIVVVIVAIILGTKSVKRWS